MVLASASSTVAGRTCRDHGGLVQPRKRRPHGSNGSRTSSVLFEIPSNFARPGDSTSCTRPVFSVPSKVLRFRASPTNEREEELYFYRAEERNSSTERD